MGGKVLDLDIIRAHDDGISQGIEQGLERGIEQGQNQLVDAIRMLKDGETPDSLILSGIDRKTVELAQTCI